MIPDQWFDFLNYIFISVYFSSFCVSLFSVEFVYRTSDSWLLAKTIYLTILISYIQIFLYLLFCTCKSSSSFCLALQFYVGLCLLQPSLSFDLIFVSNKYFGFLQIYLHTIPRSTSKYIALWLINENKFLSSFCIHSFPMANPLLYVYFSKTILGLTSRFYELTTHRFPVTFNITVSIITTLLILLRLLRRR